ncbi:MAG: hypothetical protein IKJ07_04255 [Clostridia bacterium]|nr:hypothetical protein [Clostridia bacterium]
MVVMKQKTAEINGDKIAYVETKICLGGHSYDVRFDERTKKRYNTYCRTLGFVIGKVDENSDVPDNEIEK